MIEFMLVASPTIFPAACICGSQKGPVVDTFYENARGRVYVCELCFSRLAHAFGGATAEKVDQYEANLRTMDAQCEQLLGDLEAERGNKVVSLTEAMEALRESHVVPEPKEAADGR